METFAQPRPYRARGGLHGDSAVGRGRPLSRNKHWVAGDGNSRVATPNHIDGEKWERGGHHGRGRGSRGMTRGGHHKFLNPSLRSHLASREAKATPSTEPEDQPAVLEPESSDDVEEDLPEIEEPVMETQEEREKFYQELVKAREVERKTAIAEGKMDDPLVPKRLEDAITIVGTCTDMCPRFERYRRERENNLFEWETIPGTKRVDHQRAVKMYERAAGDKTLPSDLRPPHVLKRTLDYLFHDLLPRGLQRTAHFIRDRSRAIRNDLTMQHLTGRMAIQCHDRCARFHILVMHFEHDRSGFSLPMEEQQLMNTLQSLKEFYEDQRGKYQSPTELEMRVYHRLIHIRDQKERHEDIPDHIISHPVFKLTTDFRLHVQRKSAPITKTSNLMVDVEAMEIFGKLAAVLREQGSTVMIYLVACILERLFGKETIDDIEALRGDLSIPDIIDGKSAQTEIDRSFEEELDEEMQDEFQDDGDEDSYQEPVPTPASLQPSATKWLPAQTPPSSFVTTSTAIPATSSAFATLTSTPNVFGTSSFGVSTSTLPPTPKSVFQSGSTSSFSLSAPTSAPFEVQARPSIDSSGLKRETRTVEAPGSAPNVASFFSNGGPSNLSSSGTEGNFTTPGMPQFLSFEGPNPQNAPSFNSTATHGTSTPIFKQPQLDPLAPSFTPSLPPSKLTKSETSARGDTHLATRFNATSTHISPSSASTPVISRTQSSSSSGMRSSPTPPPFLKIDTGTRLTSNTPVVASPREPPPLLRNPPISLPSTPTTNIAPPSALLSHIKSNLNTPFSPSTSSNPGFLSPLSLQSPSTSSPPLFNNFSPRGTPKDKISKSPLTSPILNGKGKAPAIDSLTQDPSSEILAEFEKNARAFELRGLVVKESFRFWLKLTTDKAAWLDACRQSDAYREKMRHSQNGTPDKKRRISTTANVSIESPKPKRARRRISSIYQSPRTDDELARRFKENHEEHERRWAQGSFLEVFKTFVKSRQSGIFLPAPWQVWLSMNSESDATAIWLERKFDVPNSGQWASDTVFSIPVSLRKPAQPQGYPGIIAFECTPIEGIDDDIERKYRILDDCSRLRGIVKSFPPRRSFTPCLLLFCWSNGDKPYSAPDFFDMVSKMLKETTIRSYHIMHMSAAEKNLDEKLENSLKALSLDLEGELVRPLTTRGLYKSFLPTLSTFVTEWIDSCLNRAYFNWKLYDLLVDTTIMLLNDVNQRVFQLAEFRSQVFLPAIGENAFEDSDSAYEVAEQWLSEIPSKIDTSQFLSDLQSHRNIDQDFPAGIFFDHVFELVQMWSERLFGAQEKRYIMLADLVTSQEAFEKSLQPYQVKLSQRLNATARRSPKRRSRSIDTVETSPEFKRARLSTSSSINGNPSPFASPAPNGRHTPSPSNSTISLAQSEASVVTVSMLRALTRDIKKKYGKNP